MAGRETGPGAIHLVGVAKTYPTGTMALRGVDLHIERGETVSLLGPSCAGKSTLLRCVNGLVHPTAGRVEVDGLAVDGNGPALRRVRQRAAMIFQQFNLVGRLSALENVLTARLSFRPVLPTLLRRFPREDYERAMLSPNGSGWPAGPASARIRCPAASASASPSRARSRKVPGSCSPTSRWRASIRGRPIKCWS